MSAPRNLQGSKKRPMTAIQPHRSSCLAHPRSFELQATRGTDPSRSTGIHRRIGGRYGHGGAQQPPSLRQRRAALHPIPLRSIDCHCGESVDGANFYRQSFTPPKGDFLAIMASQGLSNTQSRPCAS